MASDAISRARRGDHVTFDPVDVQAKLEPAQAAPTGAGGPAVAGRRLWRLYGDRVALRDVSFALARGETLVVVGPNGAGKTTLLRVLATLLRPGGGAVEVLGCKLPADAWRLRGSIG